MNNKVERYICGKWKLVGSGKVCVAIDSKTQKKVFLKEYSVNYSSDNKKDQSLGRIKNERAEKKYKRLKEVYKYIDNKIVRKGNLVLPTRIFIFEQKIYKVTKYYSRLEIEPEMVNDVFSVLQIEDLFLSVIKEIRKLHKIDVIHGDIKHDNILIGKGKNGPLGRVLDIDDGYNKENIPPKEELSVTIEYIAPEVIEYLMSEDNDDIKINTSVDIFSLGILLFYYFTGDIIKGENGCIAGEAVLRGINIDLSKVKNEFYRKLISKMIAKEPSERPTAKEIYRKIRGKKYGMGSTWLCK